MIQHLGSATTSTVPDERHITRELGAPASDRMILYLLIAFDADPEAVPGTVR